MAGKESRARKTSRPTRFLANVVCLPIAQAQQEEVRIQEVNTLFL